MKITLETEGPEDRRQTTVVDDHGWDTTPDDAVRMFAQALQGHGFAESTVIYGIRVFMEDFDV